MIANIMPNIMPNIMANIMAVLPPRQRPELGSCAALGGISSHRIAWGITSHRGDD